MEWEFSPEEVVKGEVAYDLAAFRRDLAAELAMNLGEADARRREQTFRLVYDLCHWRATGRRLEDFLTGLAHDPPTRDFVAGLDPHMESNVRMLGAILQRLIMHRVEGGEPLDAALVWVARHHEEVARRPLAPLA